MRRGGAPPLPPFFNWPAACVACVRAWQGACSLTRTAPPAAPVLRARWVASGPPSPPRAGLGVPVQSSAPLQAPLRVSNDTRGGAAAWPPAACERACVGREPCRRRPVGDVDVSGGQRWDARQFPRLVRSAAPSACRRLAARAAGRSRSRAGTPHACSTVRKLAACRRRRLALACKYVCMHCTRARACAITIAIPPELARKIDRDSSILARRWKAPEGPAVHAGPCIAGPAQLAGPPGRRRLERPEA